MAASTSHNAPAPPGRKISDDKMARLAAFLGSLPPVTAGKLFATLELDRARGGEDLPHGEMLDALRAKLFQHQTKPPQRFLTAGRLFFVPFEDFFIVERQGRKRKGRIARTSLGPIWTLMLSDPSCASAARAAHKVSDALIAGKVTTALPADEVAKVEMLLDNLYAVAVKVLSQLAHRAQNAAPYRANLIDKLGGEGVYQDFLEIAHMLACVDGLRAVRKAFAKPVSSLSEEELFNVREIYGAASAEAPESAVYVLLALAARMEDPWRALSIYYHLKSAKDETLEHAGADADVLAETLFEELETLARGLEQDAAREFDVARASLRFNHFADFADGVDAEARRRRDSVLLNRLEACRGVAAEVLERYTEQSVSAIRRAMPLRKAGGSSRLMALRPDLTHRLSADHAEEACDAAAFLARIDKMSVRVHCERTVAAMLGETTRFAKGYAEDLVTEIRAAEGEDRAAARRLMDFTLRMIAPLFASEDLGLIRDRASAAAVSS